MKLGSRLPTPAGQMHGFENETRLWSSNALKRKLRIVYFCVGLAYALLGLF